VEIIAKAIQQKLYNSASYGAGQRVFEPHAYSKSAGGNLRVHACQVSGASKSGNTEGWKLLRIDRAGNFALCCDMFALTIDAQTPPCAAASSLKSESRAWRASARQALQIQAVRPRSI
jgi:hypothetical protein